MKKKTILFILILFSVFGIYAQNKNNSSSKIQLYAGVDMGFSGSNLVSDVASGFFGGFEITPYFGLKPFSKIKGLAFEVAVQMDFMNRTVDETAINFSAISPQLLVAYNGNFGKIRPFIKAGVGVNINSSKIIVNYDKYSSTENIQASPSISMVLNPGLEFQISKLISIVGYGRFNFNLTDLSIDDSTIGEDIFIGTQSFGFGTKFNF
jgi:hypothetical protein